MLKNANPHLSLQQVLIFLVVEGLKYCEKYQKVTQRHEVSKCCWKNGTSRLALLRVATNLKKTLKKNMRYLWSAIKRSTTKQGMPVFIVWGRALTLPFFQMDSHLFQYHLFSSFSLHWFEMLFVLYIKSYWHVFFHTPIPHFYLM